ncbi:hypothetical protein J6590_005144 [Homalodisca vitripennis]|nr:hypothetical protein J6590_005144 [Homalodisca vitripennis]
MPVKWVRRTGSARDKADNCGSAARDKADNYVYSGIRGSQDVEDVGPLNPCEEDEVDADEVEEV